MTETDPLVLRAQAWIDDDPDPQTQTELRGVVQAYTAGVNGAGDDLASRFSGFLEFGTAGLRGQIGAGPNRMNRAVVIRAAAGLAAYLTETLSAAGHTPSARVVIGRDARHGSDDFAVDTAAVMIAAGHEALLLPPALPTPVLAFAVRALGADAGVMVTASHNPPQDNGYKVYLGGRVVTDAGQGAQIVPPYDALIASHIAGVASVASVPRAESGWQALGNDVASDYIAAAATTIPAPSETVPGARAALRIVFTPMHGVGGETLREALAAAGFTDVHAVPEQALPDPDFPTVDFPNPEEPGAIDLSLELAQRLHADLVIANDPDADRCAVATLINGQWQMLHGDVVGSLLGEHLAQRSAGSGGVLANSIVSSRQLAAIAKRHGLSHKSTLTGFKWIAREPGLLYGYEEALGYCVAPSVVADKDGITAALVIADMVASLKAQGRTLTDAIDDLARTYGVYLTRQVSARFTDVSLIAPTMEGILAGPPTSLGGSSVIAAEDMAQGIDGLPPTTGVRITTEAGFRVIIRPSGTEPKVKAYLEVITPVQGDNLGAARNGAVTAMDALEADVKIALGLAN